MGLIHAVKTYAFKIRESADDGSDFSNPEADYRMLFLGEDGALHAKDSAGSVTNLSGTGLGAWTDYTPTWAASGGGFVLGSSTILGRYKLLDSKTGIFRVNLTITTGGAFATGTGTWTATLPSGWTTPNDGRIQVVPMHINDANVGHYAGVAKILPNDTKTTELHAADDAAPRVTDQNSPFTWATGDTIDIGGIIEIA